MGFVAAKCTECGANIEVDETKDAGICEYCGTAFVTEKAIKKSRYDIETNLAGAEKLIECGLYDDAEKLLKKVVKHCPYDYRGWWEYAKLQYVYDKQWLDTNEYYVKALALCNEDEKSELVAYRDKKYEKMQQEGQKIIEFCENPDYSMLDRCYYVIYRKYVEDSFRIPGEAVGFEVNDGLRYFVKYGWDSSRNRYIRWEEPVYKIEFEARRMGIKIVGRILNNPYKSLYISDIKDNKIVLNDAPRNTLYSDEFIKNSKDPDSKGCYIATCVYGSYDCPEVWTLRRYRDYTLDKTWYGRAFIKSYYAISPTLVKWFGNTTWFEKFWKNRLDKMITGLKKKGVEDSFYNGKY